MIPLRWMDRLGLDTSPHLVRLTITPFRSYEIDDDRLAHLVSAFTSSTAGVAARMVQAACHRQSLFTQELELRRHGIGSDEARRLVMAMPSRWVAVHWKPRGSWQWLEVEPHAEGRT